MKFCRNFIFQLVELQFYKTKRFAVFINFRSQLPVKKVPVNLCCVTFSVRSLILGQAVVQASLAVCNFSFFQFIFDMSTEPFYPMIRRLVDFPGWECLDWMSYLRCKVSKSEMHLVKLRETVWLINAISQGQHGRPRVLVTEPLHF